MVISQEGRVSGTVVGKSGNQGWNGQPRSGEEAQVSLKMSSEGQGDGSLWRGCMGEVAHVSQK